MSPIPAADPPVESGQYTSIAFTTRLIDAGVDASVGSMADAYDNALAETTLGSFKNELIRRQGPWRDVDHVEIGTLNWVDWFNNERPHEYLAHPPLPGRCRSTALPSQELPGNSRMTQETESPTRRDESSGLTRVAEQSARQDHGDEEAACGPLARIAAWSASAAPQIEQAGPGAGTSAMPTWHRQWWVWSFIATR